METKEAVADKFEIGSNVTETAYVSHHSAFEYHGVMNQVYYEVYVSSESKFKNFEFNITPRSLLTQNLPCSQSESFGGR